MSKDELLKSLGLEDKPQPFIDAGGLPSEPVSPGGRNSPESEYALWLDSWGKRQGERLVENERIAQALGCEAAWKSEGGKARLDMTKVQEAQRVASDLFGSCFEPDPRLVEGKCTDPVRFDFLKDLMQTPDYRELHESTQLNELASEIAATAFAEALAGLRKGQEEEEGPEKDPEIECLKAAGRALKEAKEEVEVLEQAQEACGMGSGQAGGKMNLQRAAELFKKVRNSSLLRKVCELAGRFRRVARSKQRQKTTHGLDDMVGVELSGEISRMLPQELGKLGVEELELDLLRRMVEKQVLSREYRGIEPVARGPILVVVDESGSMYEEKIELAKAFALTMAWVARAQRRWCGLVGFSGATEGNLLALPPGKWQELEVLDWVEHFYGGGTDMDIPLKEIPGRYYQEMGCPKGRTDLIIITDAICHIPEAMEQSFNKWRKETPCKVYSFILGEYEPGELVKVSDEVYPIRSLDPESEEVGRVLGI